MLVSCGMVAPEHKMRPALDVAAAAVDVQPRCNAEQRERAVAESHELGLDLSGKVDLPSRFRQMILEPSGKSTGLSMIPMRMSGPVKPNMFLRLLRH